MQSFGFRSKANRTPARKFGRNIAAIQGGKFASTLCCKGYKYRSGQEWCGVKVTRICVAWALLFGTEYSPFLKFHEASEPVWLSQRALFYLLSGLFSHVAAFQGAISCAQCASGNYF